MTLLSKTALRISLILLIIGIIFSTFAFLKPSKAEAGFAECVSAGAAAAAAATATASAPSGFPVKDTSLNFIQALDVGLSSSQLAKECLLDPIAVALRETLIRKITDSIVTWINSGFEGSPAFVENVGDFLTDTADEAFGEFIYNEESLAFLCSPFQINVRFALALGYASQVRRPTCTLSDVTDNVEGAIDDLSDTWDWDTFDVITTGSNGNYFSSYVTASEDLSRLIEDATGQKIDDLNRSGGFLSYEECSPRNNPGELGTNANGITADGSSTVIGGDDRNRFTRTNDAGEDCYIRTPGSVINQQLNNTFSSDIRRLELADELDEIFSALMGQLVKQVIGGGGGITGLSRSNVGSQSFIDQYVADARTGSTGATQDINNVITTYTKNAERQIAANQEKIQLLVDAKTTVNSAYICYDSKYNTWVDTDGDVISPENLNSVPESERTRATFFRGGVMDRASGYEYEELAPEQSLAKSEEMNGLLQRIDSEIGLAGDQIESARNALEISARYESQINNSSGIESSNEIYAEFSRAASGTGISTIVAIDPLGAIQDEVDAILNGSIVSLDSDGNTERSNGAIAELESCQSFIRIKN